MDKTTVFLYRHGETADGNAKRYKGHTEVPLSKRGERQFEEAAKHLQKLIAEYDKEEDTAIGLTKVYSSDLGRAIRSAELLGTPFGLSPTPIPELRERNFGRWEGLTFDEVQSQYPDAFDDWSKDPLKFSPIGGESTEDVGKRAIPPFYELIKRHRGQRIAIVAHGGINRIIICNLLGIPLSNIFKIEQDFGCMNIFFMYDNFPFLKTLNYCT
ncbi:MAG: histidine phosphatase family protein [Candidatus Magnetoovum sp. WYHC-5]|nr:histidine phosphatase family protein [Candidatus Magnetoovum sp. WYHC-5]